MILDISPVEKLPNGTLYVRNDSTVYFKCSSPSISYPSRTLSLMFEGASSNKDTLVSGNGSLIQYEELNITPNRQGDHSCSAENTISKKIVTESLQLLVYCRHSPFLISLYTLCVTYRLYRLTGFIFRLHSLRAISSDPCLASRASSPHVPKGHQCLSCSSLFHSFFPPLCRSTGKTPSMHLEDPE